MAEAQFDHRVGVSGLRLFLQHPCQFGLRVGVSTIRGCPPQGDCPVSVLAHTSFTVVTTAAQFDHRVGVSGLRLFLQHPYQFGLRVAVSTIRGSLPQGDCPVFVLAHTSLTVVTTAAQFDHRVGVSIIHGSLPQGDCPDFVLV